MYGALYVLFFTWPLWKGTVRNFLWDENQPEQVKKVKQEDIINKDESEKVIKETGDDTEETYEKAAAAVDSHDKKND